MGTEDPDVSARLLVKCLPGYPQKCPKLQILPEKGLTRKDADQLFSLLVDQANINAREGRVMIFNLVEAAQEFLSEIVPVEQSLESNLTADDILLHATRLRNSLGRKVVKLRTRHVMKHPSVQGTWTTALKF